MSEHMVFPTRRARGLLGPASLRHHHQAPSGAATAQTAA